MTLGLASPDALVKGFSNTGVLSLAVLFMVAHMACIPPVPSLSSLTHYRDFHIPRTRHTFITKKRFIGVVSHFHAGHCST